MSKFLRRSTLIFIIKVFRTVFFIFIVISTMFRPICPPAFFRCLSNLGTFTELGTTSFIETTGVACSDSICRYRHWFPELLRRQSPEGCRFNPHYRRVIYRNTWHLYPVMANGIRTGDPCGFNKGRSSKFCEGSQIQQTPEEGWRTYQPKRCGNNNKDEDNCPKNLNDK